MRGAECHTGSATMRRTVQDSVCAKQKHWSCVRFVLRIIDVTVCADALITFKSLHNNTQLYAQASYQHKSSQHLVMQLCYLQYFIQVWLMKFELLTPLPPRKTSLLSAEHWEIKQLFCVGAATLMEEGGGGNQTRQADWDCGQHRKRFRWPARVWLTGTCSPKGGGVFNRRVFFTRCLKICQGRTQHTNVLNIAPDEVCLVHMSTCHLVFARLLTCSTVHLQFSKWCNGQESFKYHCGFDHFQKRSCQTMIWRENVSRGDSGLLIHCVLSVYSFRISSKHVEMSVWVWMSGLQIFSLLLFSSFTWFGTSWLSATVLPTFTGALVCSISCYLDDLVNNDRL